MTKFAIALAVISFSAIRVMAQVLPAAEARTQEEFDLYLEFHEAADHEAKHRAALRFEGAYPESKLLVDEIKLYNQSKVAEGKQNRDLYRVLREDIEKSRATYDKRYGGTPVAPARYFDSEIVRILADNDRSLMGSDFPA